MALRFLFERLDSHPRAEPMRRAVSRAGGRTPRPAPPPQTPNLPLSLAPLLTDRRVGVGHGPPGGEPVSFNETR